MKRREFIKLAGGVTAGILSPVAAISGKATDTWDKFCPTREYGNQVRVLGKYPDDNEKDRGREALKEHMKTIIPPHYRKYVEFIEKDLDFGRRWGAAWLYRPHDGSKSVMLTCEAIKD